MGPEAFRGLGEAPPHGAEVGKTRTRREARTYSRVVPGLSGRVLVVDDNKVIRQLIRVNLELEGFEVVTAADGAECLDIVHQVRPDVVTLDVVMPRLDGLRTAARLRADPRTCHLPVAIISACTQLEIDSGQAVGVDAFLAKPFEPVELVRLVRRLAGAAEPQPSGDLDDLIDGAGGPGRETAIAAEGHLEGDLPGDSPGAGEAEP
ncbi:response regulator, partial [Streptomyces sp. URMC 123]|uniref:response regulator n=1 Tax=Streptomyces sp. URMC 123 TaxID=3423403 RepID=UPI003F1C86D8